MEAEITWLENFEELHIDHLQSFSDDFSFVRLDNIIGHSLRSSISEP